MAVEPENTERFARVPLFVGMSKDEILRILEIAESTTASAGDTVVREGDPGDAFYVIAAGAFEVVKEGAEPKTLARLEELSFFGEMSVVSDAPRSATVKCVADGRLKKIPVERFRRLLDIDDLSAYKVVLNMSRIMAQRLARVEDQLVN